MIASAFHPHPHMQRSQQPAIKTLHKFHPLSHTHSRGFSGVPSSCLADSPGRDERLQLSCRLLLEMSRGWIRRWISRTHPTPPQPNFSTFAVETGREIAPPSPAWGVSQGAVGNTGNATYECMWGGMLKHSWGTIIIIIIMVIMAAKLTTFTPYQPIIPTHRQDKKKKVLWSVHIRAI